MLFLIAEGRLERRF